MSYNSQLTGAIHIEPPLRWGEYKDSPWNGYERAQAESKGVYLVETQETIETDDGPLNRRTAGSLVFAWDYPVKLYDIVEELQELVDKYPDHKFVGEFQGTGEDFGDIWLLRVNQDRKVERVLPTITWPDGTVLVNIRYQ